MPTLRVGKNNFLLTDIVPSMPQLLDNSKLLQARTSQPAGLPLYAESDYHWLVGVLDKLIEFMRRDGNHSVPELTENDYDWVHALLVELVGAVGESETHPLRPLMEFVCHLIDNYEDKYVPELTELFPELTEEAPIETVRMCLINTSLHVPKENFFTKDSASPPDKGDLGGFFHDLFYSKTPTNYL